MNLDKNIVLIGFMGVGKTTVGKMLAEALSWEFMDSDHVIEQKFGMPITEIFRRHGEPVFRQAEKETIEELCTRHTGKVISLGGGAFSQEAVREVCLKHCTVIYLELSWRQWKRRRSQLVENRPILQTRTNEEIRQLFDLRKTHYASNHIKIRTDGLNSDEVARIIGRLLRGEEAGKRKK